MQIFKMFSLAG